MPADLDHERLLAEIDAEARRRRTSGELPADFERDLELVFARFAPPSASAGDLEAQLLALDRASFIDVSAPVESVRPGVGQAKRLVRKAIAFEVRHVAAQVGALGHAVTAALRTLDRRLTGVEEELSPAADAWPGLERIRPRVDVGPRAAEILPALDGLDGRIVHLDAGAGHLVTGLREAGLDAYGVEPDRRLLADVDDGLVREAAVLEHLRAVADADLAGAVWSVGAPPRHEQLAVLHELLRVVRPGGRIVIAGLDPASWAADRSPVEIDLAPGRPFAPETWTTLLDRRGARGVTVALTDPPPGAPAEGPLGDWLDDLARRVRGRGRYVVVATV